MFNAVSFHHRSHVKIQKKIIKTYTTVQNVRVSEISKVTKALIILLNILIIILNKCFSVELSTQQTIQIFFIAVSTKIFTTVLNIDHKKRFLSNKSAY